MASEYESAPPKTPLWFKVGLVIVAAIGVWLAVGLVWTTLRLALAFAGYVIVAFLAYEVGKWVGRSSKEP
jgi:predicted lysophospholipase L1 biosynthesis ABC-type transport system permease subunit